MPRRGAPFPGDTEPDRDSHRPSLTTLLNLFFKKGMFGNQRSYLKSYTSRRASLPFYVFYASVFEKYIIAFQKASLPSPSLLVKAG